MTDTENIVNKTTLPVLMALAHLVEWKESLSRDEQRTPKGDWRIWLILAGRGWGKTRTGAEDVLHYGLRYPNSRIAIVAPTFADARDTCVEGESGLLGLLEPALIEKWNRSLGELILKNGTRYKLFSADEPERLRGPQHHRAWCDELAAWTRPDALAQLQFGLRLGTDPRIVITTTPKPVRLIRDLISRAANIVRGKPVAVPKYGKDRDVHLTRGRTHDNAANLAPSALAHLEAQYAGTRLGRQELEAELLDDVAGALWSRDDIDRYRVAHAPENLLRVVVAVDPAMTAHDGSDETGIICAGVDARGEAYILADASGKYSPDGWVQRVLALVEAYGAAQVVAEVNAGGDMVAAALRSRAPQQAFKPVRAAKGKVGRAIPVAAYYEQGRVHHVGGFAQLEDQMCRFTMTGMFETSPDRVDALVWALTDLLLTPAPTPACVFFEPSLTGVPMKNPFAKQKASAAAATDYSGSMMAITGLSRPRWTQRRYDAQVEEGFRKNVVAWRCVTMVAEAAAAIPLTLYDAKGRIVTRHKLLDLLRQPNPLVSQTDFLASLYVTWQLAGNVYVEAVKPDDDALPAELYQLRPDRMKVLPGPSGLPLGYEYSLNGHKHVWHADPLTGAADILHWKNFNPLDDWYGLGALDAAAISTDQHNAASSWNQALLNSAARPSGALVYNPKEGPATLTQDQMGKLRDEFDAYYTGARGAGRPLILEGGLEWQSFALTPHEMDWLKGRDAAARDIALAFGVPAQLIGLSDAQTYANMVEARLALYEETVLPLVARLLSALNGWLLPMFGERNLRLEADTDEISALIPRREAIWQKVEKASFLTINEKRTALGYPPVADGDRL